MTGNNAPLTRYGQKLARGLLALIAPVSITQARNRPLWLVNQTSLSFSDAVLSHHMCIDWRPGPWSAPIIAVRRRQVSLGSVSTVLGRDMQKVIVVIVDAVDLLGRSGRREPGKCSSGQRCECQAAASKHDNPLPRPGVSRPMTMT